MASEAGWKRTKSNESVQKSDRTVRNCLKDEKPGNFVPNNWAYERVIFGDLDKPLPAKTAHISFH